MEKKTAALPVINPHAAGIDIGSRTHWVAVDQNKENARSFGVYTQDYQQLIGYLREYGITSIAMESTGTYWQALFNALQEAGFDEVVVKCRGAKPASLIVSGFRSARRSGFTHWDCYQAVFC